MTSNVGAREIAQTSPMGFTSAGNNGLSDKEIKSRVESELKHLFRPEFLNRVDEIVVFKSLTDAQLRQVVDLMIADLRNRLIGQGMSIELTDAARDLVAKEGTDPIYGARPLRRAIQTLIEDPLAEELLAGGWRSGDVILVDAQDGHLTFTRGEGAIPEPSERIHMELPKARSHWTPSGRPASSSDLASAGGE